MYRLVGIVLIAAALSACGSTGKTAKKAAAAPTNQVTTADNKIAEKAGQPKQICRLEKQMGTNHRVRVCRSK